MGKMKNYALWIAVFFFGVFTLNAFAQDVPVPIESLISQVLKLIGEWGGISWIAKVAAIVMVLISSMKVSFLKPYWDKLGAAQAWVAPILGMIGGVLMLGADPGSSISWAGVLAYITAGAGAVFFHEILDSVKAIPGIGSVWISVIDFIAIILRAPPKA